MGQTLSSPATDKHSESGGDERFLYGVSEMQGWRISMEDAHAMVLKLDEDKVDSNTFFAVYDGHGGHTVAKFSGTHVHKRLVSEESYRGGRWDDALRRAFLGTDEDIRADPSFFRDPSGCTAVAALITHDRRIFVANAGDSRSVISVKGEVKPLSYDHKPHNEVEVNRIRNAGGYIEYGRVNGNLALSRAIGDFEFKKNFSLGPEKQIITSDPDIIEHQIAEEDEFLVLACDGIWDCLTSQQVVDIIRLQVSQRKELTEISEFLCDHCLAPDTTSGAGVGCDNMTVLIVAILNGRTKEQWYDWMVDRVERRYGYDTPTTVAEIYAPTRLNAYRARRQAYEDRADREKQESSSGSSWRTPGAFGLARSVLSGGVSFIPGTGIVNDDGALMFTNDDSDDDSGEEEANSSAHDSQSFLSALGLFPPGSSDVTKSLKAQLDELESGGPNHEVDEDGDAVMGESDDGVKLSHPHPNENGKGFASPLEAKPQTSGIPGEAPPPPKPIMNGDTYEVDQLKSMPSGDEPSAVVKAEGLLDRSEDPVQA